MLCDRCKKNQANIYYSKLVNGKMEGVKLCYTCAKEVMGSDFSMSEEIKNQIEDLLKPVEEPIQDPAVVKACPNCNTTLETVINTGRFGCPECYKTFEKELIPFLSKVSGFSMHTGHVPKDYKEIVDRYRTESELEERLAMAISLEEYEEAALYRDKLKELGDAHV